MDRLKLNYYKDQGFQKLNLQGIGVNTSDGILFLVLDELNAMA